jgi:hypothetical protein
MKLEGKEIALFCKFLSGGEPVRFANVCNVRGVFLFFFAGGKKKIK